MSTETDDFPSLLEEPLKNIINKEGYVTYDVHKDAVSTKGIGFLAKPFKVTIKGRTKDCEKETNVYVKSILPPSKMDEVVDVPHAYTSEAFVYNELSSIVTQLQDEAGIPTADRFKMIRSYGVSSSQGIFLENVSLLGYHCPPRTATVTLQVAELAIKEIAKFHAFSFIIREKRPEFYKRIEAIKSPMLFNKEFEAGVENVIKIAEKHMLESTKPKIDGFLKKMVPKFKAYYLGSNSRTKCLCHGDFRLHNLLIKEKDGEDLDLFVVDYQMININSPIIDLLYFLFMSTDGQFRNKYFEHIKNYYHDSFTDFLSKFGIDSNKVYPKREYEKDFRDQLDFGLLCGFYFLPFSLGADNDIPNPDEKSVTEINFNVHESFPKRLQDIVGNFIEWGIL